MSGTNNGFIGKVNGDLNQNNAIAWNDCSAFSSGTSIRFKIDGESRSHFWPGRRLIIKNQSGGSPFACTVLSINPADLSVGVISDASVSSDQFDSGSIYLEDQDGEG